MSWTKRSFPRENEILPAQRQLAEPALQRAEPAQRVREDEGEVGEQDGEAGLAQQAAGVLRPEHLRVAVEGDAAHDETRARIPGVVLPEGEQPAGAQRRMNLLQSCRPL